MKTKTGGERRHPAGLGGPAAAAVPPAGVVVDVAEGRVQLSTEHQLAGVMARGLVWCAVAAGPAALAWQLLPSAPAAPQVAVTASQNAGQAAAAGEVAQAWLVAWLTTPADRAEDLDRFRVTGAADLALPRVGARAEHVAVAEIQPVQPVGGRAGRRVSGSQVWSVTVAADVTASVDAVPVRRFYQVSVLIGPDGTAQVLGLPAAVAGAGYTAARPGPYTAEVSATGPLGHTVSGFLGALVAGQGDVSRWTSPQARIASVVPPAAAQVRLRRIAVPAPGSTGLSSAGPRPGQVVHALVTADLVDEAGQTRTGQWPLQLSGRDGRWEVAGIDPAPLPPSGGDSAPDPSGTQPDRPEAAGLGSTPMPPTTSIPTSIRTSTTKETP